MSALPLSRPLPPTRRSPSCSRWHIDNSAVCGNDESRGANRLRMPSARLSADNNPNKRMETHRNEYNHHNQRRRK